MNTYWHWLQLIFIKSFLYEMISNENEYILSSVATVVNWYSSNYFFMNNLKWKWIHIDIGCNWYSSNHFFMKWFQIKMNIFCHRLQLLSTDIHQIISLWIIWNENEYILTLVATDIHQIISLWNDFK